MDAMKSQSFTGGRGVRGFFLAEGKRVLNGGLRGALSTSWISVGPTRLPSSRATAISLHRPTPIPPPAVADEAVDNVVGMGMQAEGRSGKVRVTIVLEKDCVFGQTFFLVGEGPLLGNWDPSNAVPLQRARGQAWKAEMDLPIGESVKFKFICRSFTGDVDWMPGPDRVVKVWETTNSIVVTEDWENEEEQKITEEPFTNRMDDIVITDNMTDINEEPLPNHTIDFVATESMIGSNERPVFGEVATGVFPRREVRMREERIPHSTKSEEVVSFEDLIPSLASAGLPMSAPLFSDEVVRGKLDDASLANSESENYIASQVNGAAVESNFQTASQINTVHVQIVLEKACLFGQQLFIVGNHPLLGSWNPLDAVQFEWSNAHVWIAEMDLPAGKPIHFKFILRDISGKIEWQSGPDRILRVPDTINAIIVTEDWDSADKQNIVEETLNELTEDVVATKSMIGIEGKSVLDESLMSMVTRSEQSTTDTRISQSTKAEEIISHGEDLLLIAGLRLIPKAETTSVFPNGTGNGKMNDASFADDEANDCVTPQNQLYWERAEPIFAETNLSEEESETLIEIPGGGDIFQEMPEVFLQEKLCLVYPSSQSATWVLRDGIMWGRKMLNRFMINLGLK